MRVSQQNDRHQQQNLDTHRVILSSEFRSIEQIYRRVGYGRPVGYSTGADGAEAGWWLEIRAGFLQIRLRESNDSLLEFLTRTAPPATLHRQGGAQCKTDK
jgi:hypothetical protein